jgi:hypothetical protein
VRTHGFLEHYTLSTLSLGRHRKVSCPVNHKAFLTAVIMIFKVLTLGICLSAAATGIAFHRAGQLTSPDFFHRSRDWDRTSVKRLGRAEHLSGVP